MDTINVHINFLDHIADCIMLQKIINNGNVEDYNEQQGIINQTLKQLREITGEHRKKVKRSLAQKNKGMYDEHQALTESGLSEYTGPTFEKGSY